MNKYGDIKEIHVWLYSGYPKMTSTDIKTLELQFTNADRYRIDTTQLVVLQTKFLQDGLKIFLHFDEENFGEIKLGENTLTNRYIRPSMNLLNLLLAGEFGQISKI